MISLYKSYLGSGNLVEGTNVVKDPFFCMNLVCPSGSYDVNVEPAKDDILFINAHTVIGIFESFLRSIYGELRTPPAVSSQASQSRLSGQRHRGFDILLARKPQAGSKYPDQRADNAQSAKRNGDNPTSTPLADFGHPACDDLPSLIHGQDVSLQDSEEVELDGRPAWVNNPDAVAVAAALSNGVTKSVSELSAAEQRRGWQRDMYSVDEDPVIEPHGSQDDDSQLQDSQGSDEEVGLHDASISNPWAFAKLNASVRRSNIARGADGNVERNDQLLTPGRQVGELGKAIARQGHEVIRDSDTSKFGLPTPVREKEYQATSTTSRTSSPELVSFSEKDLAISKAKSASSKLISQDMNSNRGALNQWVQKPMGSRSMEIYSTGPSEAGLQGPNVTVQAPTRDFVSARTLPIGTPMNAIAERASKSTRNRVPGNQTQKDLNKPFTLPVSDPSRVWFDTESKGKGRHSQSARAQSVADAIAASNGIRFDREDRGSVAELSPTQPVSRAHPDLAATMDYEIRKQAAYQQWKANQRCRAVAKNLIQTSEDEPSRSLPKTSPHQNRYSRAIADLHFTDGEEGLSELQPPSFEPGDPRAYLFRGQEHDESARHDFPNDSSKRPRNRRKTGLLPLETILEDSSTRNLILTLGREELGLLRLSRTGGASFCDEYVRSGNTVGAFSSCTIHQIRAWEAKLRELVGRLRRGTEEDDGVADERTDSLRLDIWTSLQTHRARTQELDVAI